MLLKASESQQNGTFHRIVWPGLIAAPLEHTIAGVQHRSVWPRLIEHYIAEHHKLFSCITGALEHPIAGVQCRTMWLGLIYGLGTERAILSHKPDWLREFSCNIYT